MLCMDDVDNSLKQNKDTFEEIGHRCISTVISVRSFKITFAYSEIFAEFYV